MVATGNRAAPQHGISLGVSKIRRLERGQT
jgi:hypothetical protein